MHSILVMFFLVGARPSGAPSSSSLRADVLRWSEDVSFGCTFRLRSGVANSKEQALHGEVDPNLGSDYSRWEARGEFHKLGPKMRCLIDYGSPGIQYGPRKVDITLEPIEEATNGFIGTSRFLRRSEVFGEKAKVALVESSKKHPGEARWAGLMTTAAILPLTPMHSYGEQPFEWLQITDVRALDKEHVEVLCYGRKQGRSKRIDFWETRNRRVVFWVKPVPPVVERIEERAERTSVEVPAQILGSDECYAILSDFKQCPGGMVASHVRYLEKSEGLRVVRWKIEEPGFRVLDWKSEDLGDRLPTNADLVMSIPPDVRVIGLKQEPPRGEVRNVDLSKISPLDLEERNAMTTQKSKALLNTGLGRPLFCWGVAALMLGFVAGWRLFRRYAR
jgi:hypothetical protein